MISFNCQTDASRTRVMTMSFVDMTEGSRMAWEGRLNERNIVDSVGLWACLQGMPYIELTEVVRLPTLYVNRTLS